jgi:flagellar protein FlgJ
MSGIDTVNGLTNNMGFAAKNLGTNPGEMVDPQKNFSHLLDKNIKREKEKTASLPGIVPRQTHIDKTDKLYEQCQALETFLVKNIFTAMRKNVMKSSLIDTGFAGEIYEDMLWDEYAKEYTKNAGFGLADLAYLELTGQRGRKI